MGTFEGHYFYQHKIKKAEERIQQLLEQAEYVEREKIMLEKQYEDWKSRVGEK